MTEQLTEPAEETIDRLETSSASSAGALPRTFGARVNRRTRPVGRLRSCRVCWKPIVIEARYVEESPPHVYFRCPQCGNSFPIRRADVPGTAEGVPSVRHVPDDSLSALDDFRIDQLWRTLKDTVIDQLDIGATRALLEQIDTVERRQGASVESLALHDALHAREEFLIALEDLAQVVRNSGLEARSAAR